MNSGLSIRTKFLLVTTLLLVFCVGVYLSMATQVFRSDKKELVYDLNRSLVTNIASDLDSVFAAATDKMRLAAYFFFNRDEKNLAILKDLLAASPDIVFVAGSENFKNLTQRFFHNESFVETYALAADFFEAELAELKPIPFERLQSEGEAIWNASVDQGGPALIGYGKSVVIEGENGKPKAHFAVVAYLRADRLLRVLKQARLNQAAITTASGEVLVHPVEHLQIKGHDDSLDPLTKKAQAMNARSSVMPFEHMGQEYLGAYAHAANSRLLVVSRVAASSAFAVVNQFLARSSLVALMVLNLAFIAAILFSRSLTRPIQALMSGMEKVAEGELSTQIEVRSKDEIAALAQSFNGMIRELKTSRDALEEINRELENKVRERTLQLEKQNQAVKSAQENLLKTTRLAAVGEIAGRAAHEVLNPLTTILARLDRLQSRVKEKDLGEIQMLHDLVSNWQKDFQNGGFENLLKIWQGPSQVQDGATLWQEDLTNLNLVGKNLSQEMGGLSEDLRFLQGEAERIGRIVQSMRGLSQVESHRTPYELGQLLEHVANIMRDLASQHQTEINVRVEPSAAWAVLDQDEFLQSLTNLIRNSIQAIEERRRLEPELLGQIELSLKRENQDWSLRVIDNGAGISNENKNRLFENQFTTKTRAEGTGLGLNISRRFIRACGGDIVLEQSEPLKKTIFKVTLPISAQDDQGAA